MLSEQQENLVSSTFFLAPKRGGKWRPIISLGPLNRFFRL